MAQGYDRGELLRHYGHTSTKEEGAGRTLGDVPARGGAQVMQAWGVEGKYPWMSYYATLQDQFNWGVHRPAQTKLLPRNFDATGNYLAASPIYTPYLYRNLQGQLEPMMPYAPTGQPFRTKQVSRFGGEQPKQMGLQQLQALQLQMRSYPALMAQARAFFFGSQS